MTATLNAGPGWNPDWSLIRTFACVAQRGSLAGAARALGLAHPTVARHIQLLETNLGSTLSPSTLFSTASTQLLKPRW